jgi:hypothetical protein
MGRMKGGLWVLLFGAGIACDDGKDSAGDDTGSADTDTDDDTGGTGCEGETSVTWGATSVTFEICGGAGGYWFGMAQTNNGDAGTAGSDDWTGEDCVFGYETSTGDELRYCHDAGDTGVTLTSSVFG